MRHPAAAQLDRLAGLRARAHVDVLGALERRHLELGAERGQRRGHVEHRDEVVAVADEALVRRDRDEHVEVARRPRPPRRRGRGPLTRMRWPSAIPAGMSIADRVREHLAPAAVAARAAPLGDLAVAAADVAGDRPRDLAERRAADGLQHAVAAAAVAAS